jgi:hypothetical protein
MVFYFECATPGYTVYMGKDKFENEGLIEWGWRSDLWFHVDNLSSAHVYLRVPLETAMEPGSLLDKVPPEVVEEMCQLVKANSISGCKLAQCRVVYTPHSNLRKEADMKDGAVGFHSSKLRRLHLTVKNREMVKRIEKTRTEAHPDLQLEKMQFEKRVVQHLKRKKQEQLAAQEAVGDPRAVALAQKLAREEFLASGGYHSGALAAKAAREEEAAAAAAAAADLAEMDGEMDGLVMGGDDDEFGVSPDSDDDGEGGGGEAEEAGLTWEQEAERRAVEADVDVRWLRERGHGVEAAREVLLQVDEDEAEGAPEVGGGASSTKQGATERRKRALAQLLAARTDGGDDDDDGDGGDSAAAAEGREEEREALAAIFDTDLVELGGEDVSIPVQGYEGGEVRPSARPAPPWRALGSSSGGSSSSETARRARRR